MLPSEQTIAALIAALSKQLAAAYSDLALCQQYAWWMSEHILERSRTALLAQQKITITAAQQQEIARWVDLIINQHMPIQYLLGSVPFGDLDILVKAPILIPRPETEEWCLTLIKQIKTNGYQPRTILDLCTGSGCIALACAQAFPEATIYATDINPNAITLAQQNALHNNITNVQFLVSDLYSAVPTTIKFDLIISNPPYIGEHERPTMDRSVTAWEDAKALFADDAGYALIAKIIQQAPAHLNITNAVQPQMCLEIGYQQKERTSALYQEAGFKNIGALQDDNNHYRAIYGTYYA